MHVTATPNQARIVLSAMLAVASSAGTLTDADRTSIAAAARYIFRLKQPVDFTSLAPPDGETLNMLSANTELARETASFATVMAFVDGRIEEIKLRKVLELAVSLGVHDDFIDDIAKLAQGRLQDATAHMIRANLESVTGRPWRTTEMEPWLLPYRKAPDAALAARFRTLATLSEDTFGHAFAAFYASNTYAFPGAPAALNAAFAVPHDSTHVLAGYDTSPRGELLTSVLTAAMHPRNAMSGHVLPVILSWHLGIPLNEVAGSAKGALDPEAFWQAWARGERVSIDLFNPAWNFWSAARQQLDAVRRDVGLADVVS
jgi:tellurite resistance protein